MPNTWTPAPRTVIEAFLPADGEAPLRLIYDTANAAGIEDQPLRLAIRRMLTAGEVTRTGRGRSGGLGLTPAGRARLDRDRLGLHLALDQDRGRARWDGRWHLLAVSAPESERALRDALRRDLAEAGAAAVSTGLYVSPHDLGPLLPPGGAANLVRATATGLDVRGTTDDRAVAELLWPAAPIVAGYAALEQALAEDDPPASNNPPAADGPPAGSDVTAVLVRQIRLADALDRAMRHDPLIPPELRAAPWPPSLVRRAWLDAWTALTARLPAETLYRGWLTAGSRGGAGTK
ncbi:PaaX family transcriptional regulator [Actinoplanes sp. DH11]|uniref:PaaX family transcriptional regulator n=1 Tax=Actinoplanes sp. DH11 TaxID=2857011 RepID=UPI001E64B9DB|nr:PaaX family transcriptional regulator [Actinoplanes sp. DH11]